MTDRDLEALARSAANAVGQARVTEVLAKLAQEKDGGHTLTLVANAGVHTIPNEYLRGEIYEVSRGNWIAQTHDELVEELAGLLSNLARHLRLRAWRKVYLIPTGHPVLTANIKLLVYRVLRLNTIDLYYKDGSYLEISIDHRAISLSTELNVD